MSLCLMIALSCPTAIDAPDSALPRSRPEAQGVASKEVLRFVEAADKNIETMHSFMLLRHRHVVAEGWWAPYEASARHSLYSLSKSFTATAVGMAIAERKLNLNDLVISFFPDELPENPSANLKAMRISDLLRMSTGHQSEPPRGSTQTWTRAFLAHPVPFKPGTHFLYNTSATYMLSAIVQKATGTTLLDYLKPRLFDPLGIEQPTWELSPQGISTGGFGLSVRTEDIAKFGQLYLQKGVWQGNQLIPRAWVEAATTLQTSNGSNPESDWDQGYCYQFWRSKHNAYRGDGAFGQFCVVLPEQDAVIVITSGVKDMQAVLNLVWEKLLPALKAGELHADEPAALELESKLKTLSIPHVVSDFQIAAKPEPSLFAFPVNDQKLGEIRFANDSAANVNTIDFVFDGKKQTIVFERGGWRTQTLAWGGFPAQPAAVTGAWIDEHTFVAKICFYETPFIFTLKLSRSGQSLRLNAESNVGFGPTKQPELLGTAAKE
jgi:CubicO group peptidase (beta-lactamase class C family)